MQLPINLDVNINLIVAVSTLEVLQNMWRKSQEAHFIINFDHECPKGTFSDLHTWNRYSIYVNALKGTAHIAVLRFREFRFSSILFHMKFQGYECIFLFC